MSCGCSSSTSSMDPVLIRSRRLSSSRCSLSGSVLMARSIHVGGSRRRTGGRSKSAGNGRAAARFSRGASVRCRAAPHQLGRATHPVGPGARREKARGDRRFSHGAALVAGRVRGTTRPCIAVPRAPPGIGCRTRVRPIPSPQNAMAENRDTYPILVLRDSVLFPGILMPLSIGRPASIEAIDAAAASADKAVVVACQKDPTVEEPTLADLFPIATRAVVRRLERAGEHLVQAVVEGLERVELLETTSITPHLAARVRVMPEPTDGDVRVEALMREITDL